MISLRPSLPGGEGAKKTEEHLTEKAERFAALIPVIEEIWKEVENLRSEREDFLVDKINSTGLPKGKDHEFPIELSSAFQEVLEACASETIERLSKDMDPRIARLAQAYASIRLGDDIDEGVSLAEDTIISGFNMAIDMSYTIVANIEEAFAKRYHRAPTQQEFSLILDKSEKLAEFLASQHILALSKVTESLFTSDAGEDSIDTAIKPAYILSGKSIDAKLWINQKTRQSLARGFPFRIEGDAEPRFGCPALYSKNANKESIVQDMYRWYADIIKKYYVPNHFGVNKESYE